MSNKFTDLEIALYHAGVLGKTRSDDLMATYLIDPELRIRVDAINPRLQELDLMAFQMAMEDESDDDSEEPDAVEVSSIAEAIANAKEGDTLPTFPKDTLVKHRGAMVFRNTCTLGAKVLRNKNETETEFPLISTDYDRKILTIRESFDEVPDGKINLVIIRTVNQKVYVTYKLNGIQMNSSRLFWTIEIPIGDLNLTDLPSAKEIDFYYAVIPEKKEA